jgi:hypothetical protein
MIVVYVNRSGLTFESLRALLRYDQTELFEACLGGCKHLVKDKLGESKIYDQLL